MLFDQLTALLQRGVRVRMVLNRFTTQPRLVQQRLRQLQTTFVPLLELVSFDPDHLEADLHAKIIVVDRQHALVGSANLSQRGLVHNHELGVVVTGSAAVDVARTIERLLRSPYATVVST